jgi:CRP/FNR family cyclic AMP-dependent transcriptional regulator
MPFQNKLTSPWIDNLPYNWNVFNTEGKTIHFQKNDYIFHEGDCLDYVYIVLDGRIRIYLNTANGKEKTLMVIGKNGLLGEHFIQGNNNYTNTAIAVTKSTLLRIEKNKFHNIAFSEKQFLTQWLKILSLKTEVLTQSYSNLFFSSIRKRLASFLIHLVETYGKKTSNNLIKIEIKFTHQELADFIGSSRVAISNEISQLQKEKIILKIDKFYYLKDISKLKSIYNYDE